MTRLFPSSLMGCLVPCESQGELEHWMTLEADGSVVAARAQPDAVSWSDEGTERRHTPDAEVRFDDGRVVLREVKPWSDLSSAARAAVDHRTAVLQASLACEGITYELVNSKSPAFGRRVASAKQVLAARRATIRPGLDLLVREAVLLRGGSTLGCIERLIPHARREELLVLVLRRKLIVDLEQGSICPRTSVRIPNALRKETNQWLPCCVCVGTTTSCVTGYDTACCPEQRTAKSTSCALTTSQPLRSKKRLL
ncbi:hypothetical protein [Falsiroseomonas sp. HW251]|uniref:hypothetical protein n=1 Tax=Falsiroseomonas sp. HW251 TaxID=3390998 RepID=UPI003D318845